MQHRVRTQGSLGLALLAMVILALACSGGTGDPKDGPAVPDTAEPFRPEPAEQIPPFLLIDGGGRPFDSETLYGKLWVAQFVSAGCSDECAQAADRMQSLASSLSETEHAELRLLSFIDGGDAASIAGSAPQVGGWKALGGRPNQMKQLLRNGFGVEHSHAFALVGRRGEYLGAFEDVEPLASEIRTRAAIPAAGSIPFPEEILNPVWLPQRAARQIAMRGEFVSFNDFSFTDRLLESGITFVNRTTDDSGKAYKPVHYDHGNGIAVADVDGDDVLDLFFTNQLGANELWRGLGGGEFDNITGNAPYRLTDKISVTATFADTDNDGDPDLYVTTVDAGNHLFENDGAGRFTDITDASGLGYVAHSSGATFFDYDRDGNLDLFLSNVGVYTGDETGPGGYAIGFNDAFAGHLKPEERDEPNLLFRNRGDNRFEDVSAAVGLDDTSWSGDATAIDANGDG